ncbi:MAG TPA: hypothetical protein VHK63_09945 [Candidatus Limnocylindria bacterium]|nr:hypothetical protein [Candidatus Limnocylindria bacterium]
MATRDTVTIDETGTVTTSEIQPGTEGEHPLAEAGQRAGEGVGQLAERATSLGYSQADRSKEQAAQGISQVATSLRRVASDMEGEQPAIADAGRTAAEQAERLATYLQQTDAREIVRTVEDAARRQPLIFLGGAFLVGLAAARFLKAAGGDGSGNRSTYGSGYRSSTYGTETGYGTGTGYGTETGYGTGTGYGATTTSPTSEGI